MAEDKNKSGEYFDMEIEEWGLKPSNYSFEKRIELGTNFLILKRLDEIAGLLRSMKQQEKDYWETWKQAKSKESSA